MYLIYNRHDSRGCFLWKDMHYNKTNVKNDFYSLRKLIMKTIRNVKPKHSENNSNHTTSTEREHHF